MESGGNTIRASRRILVSNTICWRRRYLYLPSLRRRYHVLRSMLGALLIAPSIEPGQRIGSRQPVPGNWTDKHGSFRMRRAAIGGTEIRQLMVLGPKFRDACGNSVRQRSVRGRGRGQPCMVDSGVGEPEATVCKAPRVPQCPWRYRPSALAVQVPLGQRAASDASTLVRCRCSPRRSGAKHAHCADREASQSRTVEIARVKSACGRRAMTSHMNA